MRLVIATVGAIVLTSCTNQVPSGAFDHQMISDFSKSLPSFVEVKDAQPTEAYEGEIVLVNESYGSPRRLERITEIPEGPSVAPDAALQESAKLMAQKLFGEYELKFLHLKRGPLSNYVTFQQTYKGREVVGAKLIIRLDQAAEWTMSSTTLVHPAFLQGLDLSDSSAIASSDYYGSAHQLKSERSVVYTRVDEDNKVEAYAAREFSIYDPNTYQEILFWVDEASHKMVGFHNLTGNLDQIQMKGSIVPNQPGDVATFALFPRLTALLPDGSKVPSNDSGAFDIDLVSRSQPGQEVKVYLENDIIVVSNNERATTGAALDNSRVNDGAFILDEGPTIEERNIFYWVMYAKAFLKEKFNYTRGVGQITAIAKFGENFDNAFFMPGSNMLAFGGGYQFLKNTALSRDIIIHEFGHSTIQEMYGTVPGYEFSAMNEAMSDYLAALVTNHPLIAEGAMQERTGMEYLRTVENNYVYPKDMTGKGFHVDGQIFSGALWTMRKLIGPEVADRLVHEAQLAQAKTVHEFYRELLALDEDQSDRNPWTPSPNEAKIRKAFRMHGIGSADAVLSPAPMKDYTIPWKRGCWSL